MCHYDLGRFVKRCPHLPFSVDPRPLAQNDRARAARACVSADIVGHPAMPMTQPPDFLLITPNVVRLFIDRRVSDRGGDADCTRSGEIGLNRSTPPLAPCSGDETFVTPA